MAKRIKIRKNLRVYLDEEPKMVPQVDDESGDPLFIQAMDGDVPRVDEEGAPVFTDKRVEEEEMVSVVRIIGKEYPEPEDGTIFHLALMRFRDAMRFNNLGKDDRAKALDEYAPMSIRGWEHMLDDDDKDIEFKPEYVEFIDTIDRLHLVMASVVESMGGSAKKGKG